MQPLKQQAPFRLGHRPALDGLRGIFVLTVVALHAGIPFMQGGGLGVDGFFVLSGFLITCLLLQEWQRHGVISLNGFYVRRALRLLPAFYSVLAVIGIITMVCLTGDLAVDTQRGLLLSFLYCSNWFTVFFGENHVGLGLLLHTWSLGIEEQFYLVWPVLLIGLLRLRLREMRLVAVIGTLAVVASLRRVWLVMIGTSFARMSFGTDTRVDALLIGCTWGLDA